MAPRQYNSEVRRLAEAQTLRRIVAATVELHKEKGVMASTHAEIAERAGVSVPTVYKHFPTRHDLLPACMGCVEKDAPAVDPATICAAPDLDGRLTRMVDAIHARYRYFHPWYRWAPVDAPYLPEVAAAVEAANEELERLVRGVLTKGSGISLSRDKMALVLVLLDYATWLRMSELLVRPKAVSKAVVQALRLVISTREESE